MHVFQAAWDSLRYGGAMVYPLLVLGVLAIAIILDRTVAYFRCLRLPARARQSGRNLWLRLGRVGKTARHGSDREALTGGFCKVIADNRSEPAWWVESRAGDEAGLIEKVLNRGLWLLETVVTAAPLMGLLGTITGMMAAFNVIGSSGLVAPHEVTAGVAQALIATALGLFIALISLFGFNFFSRMQSHALDRMERLGSRLVDHIRLDQENAAGRSRIRAAPRAIEMRAPR